MEELKHIVESLLFVSDTPLGIDQLTNAVPGVQAEEMREALSALQREYEGRRGGFYLQQVAGGYQLRSRPEYQSWIRRLLQPQPARLSKAALETLAVIAYKQPVLRSDIEHIRGVDCGGVLRLLLEKRLIRILGRKEIPGRPLVYATSKRFLEVFGLRDLRELPTLEDMEEVGLAAPEAKSRLSDSIATNGEPAGEKVEPTGQKSLDSEESEVL